jgi:hypothetical protein
MIKLARPDPELPGYKRRRNGRSARRDAAAAIAVTERALAALVTLRTAEHARPGQALGLVVGADGSINLVLDLPGARDRVFSHNDTPILFIDADVESRLTGRILDHEGTPGQERFTLERAQYGESRPPSIRIDRDR